MKRQLDQVLPGMVDKAVRVKVEEILKKEEKNPLSCVHRITTGPRSGEICGGPLSKMSSTQKYCVHHLNDEQDEYILGTDEIDGNFGGCQAMISYDGKYERCCKRIQFPSSHRYCIYHLYKEHEGKGDFYGDYETVMKTLFKKQSLYPMVRKPDLYKITNSIRCQASSRCGKTCGAKVSEFSLTGRYCHAHSIMEEYS